MADFTYPELNSDQGTQTADTLRNAANAAADVVCNLYENYPRGLVPSFGDPTGLGAFTDGLLNRLCSPRGQVPLPPSAPFSGGQCVCVQYDVNFNRTGYGLPDASDTVRLNGPIGTVQQRQVPGSEAKQTGVTFGGSGCASGFYVFVSSFQDGNVAITSVTRVDGNPDSCGSPPVEYPDVEIPPINFSPNITVGLPGGAVSIPVTVIPTLIRPTVNLRPEFNVNVGGINVNFNLGGVDFTLNTGGGGDVILPPGDSRPVPPPNTPPKEPIPQECDLDGVLDLLEDIKECACTEERSLLEAAFGGSSGQVVPLPADSKIVTLEVLLSSGVKMEVGAGTAPDVYYLGWYSFGRGTSGGQRIPLSFLSSALLVPEGSSNFIYSLNYGSTATGKVFYLEPE